MQRLPHWLHHYAPMQQLLPQVIGADAMLQRNAALRCGVQPGFSHGLCTRGRQAVVKTTRQWAGVAVAGFAGVFAGLVFGHQRQHAQRARGQVLTHTLQGVQRGDAAGALAGQVNKLVQALAGHGTQHGKQRSQRFPQAGGRLGQQTAAVDGAAVDRLGHVALAGSKGPGWEGQRLQSLVARRAVRRFLLRPVRIQAAALDQQSLQLTGRAELAQHRFMLRAGVHIDQRQMQLLQTTADAQQCTIGLQLRPVQVAPVFGHRFGRAAQGLDLFQPVRRRVVAVGPSAHTQRPAAALQREFALVGRAAPGLHGGLPLLAFQGRGRGCEAAVQVTVFGGEFAQATHGYRGGWWFSLRHVRADSKKAPAVAGGCCLWVC